MLLHDALDVLDDDDGIVDDDADRQHNGQQRNGVGGISDRLERDEGADQADGDRKRRNQGGADIPEKQEHDDDDKDKRLDQCLLHLVHGVGDEHRRIVSDLPGQVVRKPRLQFGELGADRLDGGDGVATRRLVDHECRGIPPVEPRITVDVGGAELDAGDVAQPQGRSVRIGANDDVLEFRKARSAGPWSGC